ncbi:hypothetical protein [Leuconostoc mesenteroides]|uniref:hypothetical protein n=1 Tax=Leuconostoc mesenteroides TaxID=1245 RepID=UPI002072DD1E|nr:hypothetical protein [Leuconostoc mesenteroides]MCM6832308.1 hypothetical protein [Leuconostoc mesenteroides]
MAGGPNYKVTNEDTQEDALITIYQVENSDLEEVVEKIAEENNLSIDKRKQQESAAVGSLAGLALEVINILNHPTFTAALNLAAAIPVGRFLYLTIKDAIKKGESFKISAKGIGYIATFLNKDKVSEKDLEVIGPFSISNPNPALHDLTDINISGLDKISGVLIAFKFKVNEQINQTNWEIYNDRGEVIISWETHEAI